MNHSEKKKLAQLYRAHINEDPILPEDIVWIRNMVTMFPRDCREVYDEVMT